jgi:hypothetical protein
MAVYTPVLGDVLEAKLFCYESTSSQVSVNVLHYVVTSVLVGGVDMQGLVNAIDAAFALDYQNAISAKATYYGAQLAKIWPLPRTEVSQTNASAGAGLLDNTLLPTQVSLVCTKRTGLAGRAFRGRFYLPFPPVNAVTANGGVATAYATAVSPLFNDLRTVLNVPLGGAATTLFPVVWHRAAHTYTPILTVHSNAEWGNQRRRGDYGRINAIPPF